MAANDGDFRCTLPLPFRDEDLEISFSQGWSLDNQPISSSPLSGFLDFSRLCQISGQVQSLQAPSEIRDLGNKTGQRRVMDLALDQEKSLDEWLKNLPDSLRSSDKYAYSMPSRHITDHHETLVDSRTKPEMSIQGLILHAGTLIALYR